MATKSTKDKAARAVFDLFGTGYGDKKDITLLSRVLEMPDMSRAHQIEFTMTQDYLISFFSFYFCKVGKIFQG